MFERFEKYLDVIESKLLNKYFEQQKDYIHCKLGCSFCCESGEYPFSELEFQYAMLGYNSLSEKEKKIIYSHIETTKAEKAESHDQDFMYRCPFLIDKKCSIYLHRGLICRTHGLMYFIENENGESRNKGPDCINRKLNYSNVYDPEKKMISLELWEKTGIEVQPVAYNISQKALLKSDAAKYLELDFGETKALIDWF